MSEAARNVKNALDDRTRKTNKDGRYLTEIDAGRWHQGLRDFEFNSSLPSIAANVLKTKELRFFMDHIFLKEGGSGLQTAMHQDLPYFPFQGEQCAVCWVPVDSVRASSGGMRYVRSSHLWREFSPTTLITNERTHDSPVPMLPSNIFEKDENGTPLYDVVQFDAEPGDVIIHHPRTVHGSSGNVSESRRLAASIRYVGDDIRWLSKPTVVPLNVIKICGGGRRKHISLRVSFISKCFGRRTLRKFGIFRADTGSIIIKTRPGLETDVIPCRLLKACLSRGVKRRACFSFMNLFTLPCLLHALFCKFAWCANFCRFGSLKFPILEGEKTQNIHTNTHIHKTFVFRRTFCLKINKTVT